MAPFCTCLVHGHARVRQVLLSHVTTLDLEIASESSCDDYLLDVVSRSTTPTNSKRDIPARKERNTTKNVGPEALKKSRLNHENTREEKNLKRRPSVKKAKA